MSDVAKKWKGGYKGKIVPKPPKKQPSEEAAEEVEEIKYEDYQAHKLFLLKKAVLSDRMFVSMRTELKEMKTQEVIDYKWKVAHDECPEFLAQKAAAEAVMQKKRDINLAKKEMRMAQIADEFEAEMEMNETQYKDNLVDAKERFVHFFTELKKEKEERNRNITQIMAILLQLPVLPNETNTRPVHTATVSGKRPKMSRSLAITREHHRIAAEEAKKKQQGKK